MTDEGDKTFVRVTNSMIYEKLTRVEKAVLETNGKVKTNRTLINWLWAVLSAQLIALVGLTFSIFG